MKTVQLIATKLLGLIVLLKGAFLLGAWNADVQGVIGNVFKFYQGVLEWTLPHVTVMVLLGLILFVVGLLVLLPELKGKRRGRTISYDTARGNVTIQLDAIEQSIINDISTLPEVAKLKLEVDPVDDNRSARVTATLDMKKRAGTSIKDETDRIKKYIEARANDYLGVEEVSGVIVNVTNVDVDADASVPPPSIVETPSAALPAPVEAPPAVELEVEQAPAKEDPNDDYAYVGDAPAEDPKFELPKSQSKFSGGSSGESVLPAVHEESPATDDENMSFDHGPDDDASGDEEDPKI
jgi:hypothetical protein